MTDASSASSSQSGSLFGPLRRIITSHDPSDTSGSHVTLHDDQVDLRPVLGGNAYISPLYTSLGLPAINPHVITTSHIEEAIGRPKGVVLPQGVNGQVTDLLPNFKVGMHRTSSIDYNVILRGSAWLITPDPTAEGGQKRTEVKAGELVVQTGTIHAWEAGPEGARWITVVVAALPVEVEKDGKKESLEDVDF